MKNEFGITGCSIVVLALSVGLSGCGRGSLQGAASINQLDSEQLAAQHQNETRRKQIIGPSVKESDIASESQWQAGEQPEETEISVPFDVNSDSKYIAERDAQLGVFAASPQENDLQRLPAKQIQQPVSAQIEEPSVALTEERSDRAAQPITKNVVDGRPVGLVPGEETAAEREERERRQLYEEMHKPRDTDYYISPFFFMEQFDRRRMAHEKEIEADYYERQQRNKLKEDNPDNSGSRKKGNQKRAVPEIKLDQ